MDIDELFKDINKLTDDKLKMYYQALIKLWDETMCGYDGINNWIGIFMDGIRAECADRMCETTYNSSPGSK